MQPSDVIFHVQFFFFYSILGGQDAINLNPIIRQSGSGQGPLTEVYLSPIPHPTAHVSVSVSGSLYLDRSLRKTLVLKSIHLGVFCWRGSPLRRLPLGSWPPEGIYRSISYYTSTRNRLGLVGDKERGLLQLTRCMKCLNWCWTILPPDWAQGWRVKRREK